MTQLIAILVGFMVSWVKPASPHDVERYRSIANDAYMVSTEQDWIGLEPVETALVILSIASYESNFRSDVDSGAVRGDGGLSVCLGQIKTHDPVKRAKLAKDRKACFRAMLEYVDRSWSWCRKLPWDERLSGYTVGKCVRSPTSRRYSKRIAESLHALWDSPEFYLLEDPDADVVFW